MISDREIKKAKLFNYTCFSIVVLLWIIVLVFICVYRAKHTFSENIWKEDIESRSLMVSDLQNKYSLVGMTQDQITDLLGPPNNDPGYFTQEDRYVYCLGSARSLIDREWLVIDFHNGIVSNVHMNID